MSDDFTCNECALRGLAVEINLGEILGPGATPAFNQSGHLRADPALEMARERDIAGSA